MKRIAVFILISVIAYSIYFDLTEGTIQMSHASFQPIIENESDKGYINAQIFAGDTVISIAEKIHQGPIPVPIDQLIDDFQSLNEISPNEIQIGQHYKFPFYHDKNE